MQDRALRVASLAFFVYAGLLVSPAAACPVTRGEKVVLVSQELDPDVFLWDSSERVVKYATGDFDVETVLRHTTLVRAYSHAVALGCRNGSVRSSFGRGADATVFVVGIRISSGRAQGHYGWVLSSDIRGPDGRPLTVGRKGR
jgi:hypothetical protein